LDGPLLIEKHKRSNSSLAAVQAVSQNSANDRKAMTELTPCQNVEEALEAIRKFDGSPDEFNLAVANTLLDPMGVNIAIVTDAILAKGWLPDGFEEKGDHRLHRYKAMA
jgi:hypothetical protein